MPPARRPVRNCCRHFYFIYSWRSRHGEVDQWIKRAHYVCVPCRQKTLVIVKDNKKKKHWLASLPSRSVPLLPPLVTWALFCRFSLSCPYFSAPCSLFVSHLSFLSVLTSYSCWLVSFHSSLLLLSFSLSTWLHLILPVSSFPLYSRVFPFKQHFTSVHNDLLCYDRDGLQR